MSQTRAKETRIIQTPGQENTAENHQDRQRDTGESPDKKPEEQDRT